MRSTRPGSGASLPRSPQIPHMPGAQGYAVVSCHVERPLDDAGLEPLPRPLRAPAGRVPDRVADAPAGRRRGRASCSSSAPARRRRSGRSATTRTGRRRRTRGRPAAIPAAQVLREGRWLRERGLEPRFFCGGGWYMDADVLAAVAELGYVDCTATAARPSFLPPASPRALARRAGLDPPRRRPPRARAADDALARPGRARARGLAAAGRARALPRLRAARPQAAHRAVGCAAPARSAATAGRARTAVETRARGGVGRRMRRLIALAALAAALTACGGGSGSSAEERGIGVRVDKDPFRITVLRDGKAVVAQDADARLRYQLAGDRRPAQADEGDSSTASGDHVYEVATDEAGPHGARHVRERRNGVSLSMTLRPGDRRAAGLRRLRDRPGRPLPRQRRARRQRRPARPGRSRSRSPSRAPYAAVPFFMSSAGWGVRLATDRVVGARVPGLAGRHRLPARRAARLRLPAARGPRRGLRHGRTARRGALRRDVRRRSSTRTRRRPGARGCRRRRELELIKWRDVNNGPARGARGHAPLAGGRDPARLDARRQPVGDVQRHAHVRPARFPDPAGLIRQVHAKGVRFMLWVSPKVTCGAGYPPGAELGAIESRTLDLRRTRRRRRVPEAARAGCARSASTASRATAATRSTSRRSARRCRTGTPCCSRRRRSASGRPTRARSSARARWARRL